MATTRHLVPHIQPGGMDSTNPPHLVADGTWTMIRGFRVHHGRLVQMPLLIPLNVYNWGPLDNLFALPVGNQGLSTIFGIGPLYVVRLYLRDGVDLGDGIRMAQLDGTVPIFDPFGSGEEALLYSSATLYNGYVWFTSPKMKVRYTEGTYLSDPNPNPTPSARYIEAFFDHIVVANNTYKGMHESYTVRWSHLYDPTQWEPTDTNEADFFDITCWQENGGCVNGITGLGKLGDFLYVYTDSVIVRCTYVGLPKVMQLVPVSGAQGFGNSLHGGLVKTRDKHFYYNVQTQSFYVFDGQSLANIGLPITKAFVADYNAISNDTSIKGFAIEEKHEVWWVVRKSVETDYHLAYIYNWEEKVWYTHRLWDNRQISTAVITACATTIDEGQGAIDSHSSTSIDQTLPTDGSYKAYGRVYAILTDTYREELASDGIATLLTPNEAPYLETKDFIANLQEVGEIDQMVIHADYVNAGGIEVYVSTRMNLHDPVVFKKVGLWTKNLRDGKVSFTPMKGRVFRYRFNPIGNSDGPCRGVVFYSYTDNLFSARAER